MNPVQSTTSNSKLKSIPTGLQERLTPQAIDVEKAVLGSLLIDNRSLNDCIDILQPQVFYDPKHQYVFKAIQELFDNSQPVDILTVAEQLKSDQNLEISGGPIYLTELTNNIGSTANVETHARLLLEKFILRELIRISNDTVQLAFDETTDVFDLLDKTEKDLYTITEGNIKKSYAELNQLMKKAIDQIEKLKNDQDGISGVPSGFRALDALTSGWQKSDLIIIAARPGMGKTAFVLSMARNMSIRHKRSVGVFSLEMSSVQLVNRLISSESEISGDKLRKGNLRQDEFVQLHQRIKGLSQAPIFIDDTPAISIFELRAKCRRLKQRHNVELIIVDYLQLMTAGSDKKSGNREQEISTISRSLKSIAKELEVPVIALSQLSRAVEQRGGTKRPMLSDLRESGAIEQDADLVGFIYRPEYYGLTEDENGFPTEGIAEFIIAKHRNGALDNIRLKFTSKYAKFDNLEEFDTSDITDLTANEEFTTQGPTMTVQSRMNEPHEDMGPFEQ